MELTVGVALDLFKAAGRRLSLQHEDDRVLLFRRQRVVARKALGDVDAHGLRVAADLQHVAVEVAVNIAVLVARDIRDQEVVQRVVLLIIGKRTVPVARDGRLDHLQIIDGVLVNGHAVLLLGELDRHIAVGAGLKGHLLPGLFARLVSYGQLVVVQQTILGPGQASLEMTVGIGVKLDRVYAALAGDVRAGGGDGPGLRNGNRTPLLIHASDRGGIVESNVIAGIALNAGRICDGQPRLIGNRKRAGRTAVVKGGPGRRRHRDRSVVDGLVVGEGVLDCQGVAIIQPHCIRVHDDFVGREVAVEAGKRLLRKRRDNELALNRPRDDVVPGGIPGHVQRHAGEDRRMDALFRRRDPGADAGEAQSVHAGREAGHALLVIVVVSDGAVGREYDGRGVDHKVAVGNTKADLEVRVDVGKLIRGQAHIRRARIGPDGRDHAIHLARALGRRELDILLRVIELIVCRGGIPRHGMLLAVIDRMIVGVVPAGYGDGHRGGGDDGLNALRSNAAVFVVPLHKVVHRIGPGVRPDGEICTVFSVCAQAVFQGAARCRALGDQRLRFSRIDEPLDRGGRRDLRIRL